MEVNALKKIILYTQPTCPPCHAEKLWFEENGIEFEERDIRKDDRFLQELIELGAQATPATLIKSDNGEDEVILGFDPDRFAELAWK